MNYLVSMIRFWGTQYITKGRILPNIIWWLIVAGMSISQFDASDNKRRNPYIIQKYPSTLFTANWCGHALHYVGRWKLRMIRQETINWRNKGNWWQHAVYFHIEIPWNTYSLAWYKPDKETYMFASNLIILAPRDISMLNHLVRTTVILPNSPTSNCIYYA